MHIGMVTACYQPVVNGVTQMVALYDGHLTAAGHRVSIFTLGAPAAGEDRTKVIRSPAVPLGRTGYYVAPRYSREAQARLREVDVIHCHHLLMGLEFAKRYGTSPVVFTNHTRYDLYLSAYVRLPLSLSDVIMRGAWPRVTQMADVVIAPSASAQRILREAGVRAPIEVIENGVELESFRHPKRRLNRKVIGLNESAVVFVYVGRLSREKNVRRLVYEFGLATGAADEFHLLLAGGGPLQEELVGQVGDAGLADRVHFLGQVPPEAVPDVLAIGDVFLSASQSEIHPLTVIEALAAGLPVIAIASPGISDTVEHDRSGYLTDGTPGSLAEAMMLLGGDRVYRQRLAEGARLAAAGYDIQATVARTVALYERLTDSCYGRESGRTTGSEMTAVEVKPSASGHEVLSSGRGSHAEGCHEQ